jgi:hypothetical protein
MASSIQGYKNKHQRALERRELASSKDGVYEHTYLFYKGEMRCVLAVFTNCFELEFYKDSQYSQHLDWDEAICKNTRTELPKNCRLLDIAHYLITNGFQPKEDIIGA